jgi:hypothetical protein
MTIRNLPWNAFDSFSQAFEKHTGEYQEELSRSFLGQNSSAIINGLSIKVDETEPEKLFQYAAIIKLANYTLKEKVCTQKDHEVAETLLQKINQKIEKVLTVKDMNVIQRVYLYSVLMFQELQKSKALNDTYLQQSRQNLHALLIENILTETRSDRSTSPNITALLRVEDSSETLSKREKNALIAIKCLYSLNTTPHLTSEDLQKTLENVDAHLKDLKEKPLRITETDTRLMHALQDEFLKLKDTFRKTRGTFNVIETSVPNTITSIMEALRISDVSIEYVMDTDHDAKIAIQNQIKELEEALERLFPGRTSIEISMLNDLINSKVITSKILAETITKCTKDLKKGADLSIITGNIFAHLIPKKEIGLLGYLILTRLKRLKISPEEKDRYHDHFNAIHNRLINVSSSAIMFDIDSFREIIRSYVGAAETKDDSEENEELEDSLFGIFELFDPDMGYHGTTDYNAYTMLLLSHIDKFCHDLSSPGFIERHNKDYDEETEMRAKGQTTQQLATPPTPNSLTLAAQIWYNEYYNGLSEEDQGLFNYFVTKYPGVVTLVQLKMAWQEIKSLVENQEDMIINLAETSTEDGIKMIFTREGATEEEAVEIAPQFNTLDAPTYVYC